jgi:hypothetical protein
MKPINRISIRPKTAFTILVVLSSVIVSILIPLSYRFMEKDVQVLDFKQIIYWGLTGFLAGTLVAIAGCMFLSENVILKIIPFVLIITIILLFIIIVVR